VKSELTEARQIIAIEEKRRILLEDEMKKMLIKNMKTMNMEALNIFQTINQSNGGLENIPMTMSTPEHSFLSPENIASETKSSHPSLDIPAIQHTPSYSSSSPALSPKPSTLSVSPVPPHHHLHLPVNGSYQHHYPSNGHSSHQQQQHSFLPSSSHDNHHQHYYPHHSSHPSADVTFTSHNSTSHVNHPLPSSTSSFPITKNGSVSHHHPSSNIGGHHEPGDPLLASKLSEMYKKSTSPLNGKAAVSSSSSKTVPSNLFKRNVNAVPQQQSTRTTNVGGQTKPKK
jgi:hypothetical protein